MLAPIWFEWWYYAQVLYAVMGAAVGLSIGSVGVVMLGLLAVGSVLQMGRHSLAVLLPLTLPFAFAATHLAMQILFLRESPMNENIRPIITWLLAVVPIQCLAMRRGFPHRAGMAMAIVGICTLPYLSLYHGVGTRFGLSAGISIANPNDLAAWFGFCSLFSAVVGLEARRPALRLIMAAATLGFILVIVLTVSRGPLLALALALVVAFRRVLKRGFFALLPLVTIGWLVYALGVFDQSAALYGSRGLSDSGRFAVWPLAIERFVNAPLTGVGISKVATVITEKDYAGEDEFVEVTPHNQFIFIALASGVMPLLLFLWYWLELGRWALRLERAGHEDAVLLLPMLLYVFLIGLLLNQPYMAPWSVVVLGAVSANGFLLRAKEVYSRRTRAERIATAPPHRAVAPSRI
jgi:hypothetical protein